MSYTISKYDAIKAVLKVEKQKHELANELMMALRRAARYEITTNNYKTFYSNYSAPHPKNLIGLT